MAKPKQKAEQKPSTGETIEVFNAFSTEESQKLGQELAKLHGQADELELRKKSSSAEFTARIKELKALITEACNKLRAGGENRQTEVEARFDKKKGTKKYYHHCPSDRNLHGKFIREAAMTEEDYQLLQFQAPEKGEAAEPPKPPPEPPGKEEGVDGSEAQP